MLYIYNFFDFCLFSVVFFFFLSWKIGALQCCVSFCCAAKWISYTYACIPSSLGFLPIEVTTEHWVALPVLYSRFSLVIYSLHVHARTCICVCVCVLVAQSCPTLCDPMDCSLLGSSVHGFSRQEYWKGLLCPPPGDLSSPGVEPASPKSSALACWIFTTSVTWEAHSIHSVNICHVYTCIRITDSLCCTTETNTTL